jgi:hypothetical protein
MPSAQNLGKIIPDHKGSFDEAIQYNQLDEVFYLGSTYRVKLGSSPPVGTLPTNISYWVKTASSAAPISNVEIAVNSEDNYAYDITFTTEDGSVYTVTTGNLRGLPGEINLSAAELLTVVKSVDGDGSGLDADTLDGLEATHFLNASNLNTGSIPSARFSDTSHGTRGGGTLHSGATTESAGFMSSADKSKLDAIDNNANNIASGDNTEATAGDGTTAKAWPATALKAAAQAWGKAADTLGGEAKSYFLAASSYTAADVLAKLLTVDGAGSGLDADTVDGFSTSTSSVPNTLVARDGNGNIYGTKFYTSALEVTDKPSHVFIEDSSDGFISRQTLEKFKSFVLNDINLETTVNRHLNPGGGFYEHSNLSANYIKIMMPTSASNAGMVSIVVEIYTFTSSTPVTLYLAGYNIGNSWYSSGYYAQMISGEEPCVVRWVNDGSSRAGWVIGNNNIGTYARVSIKEVNQHYVTSEDISKGFLISAIDDLSGLSVQYTKTVDYKADASSLGSLASSNMTISSSDPSGGENGDIWVKI